MDNSKKQISSIEDFLYELTYKQVSNNVHISNFPTSITDKVNDMVVISIPGNITDYGAMARGYVYVMLYAKPLNKQIKNTKALKELESKLDLAIENNKNQNYQLVKYKTYQDYDNAIKWHFNIVELIINIF
ncbi:MAG: hypothetical protein ACI35S_06755 [Anaeroplasma sp.]